MDFNVLVGQIKKCIDESAGVDRSHLTQDYKQAPSHWSDSLVAPNDQYHLLCVHLDDEPAKKHEIMFLYGRGGACHHMYVQPAGQDEVGPTGPWLFTDQATSSDLAITIMECLRALVRVGPKIIKTWTLREAYETNKTLQKCCVCGKSTETRSLCTSNVQYCRCIEQLGK